MPRFELAFNIPVDIAETLRRDPEGEFRALTPEEEEDAQRWLRTHERP